MIQNLLTQVSESPKELYELDLSLLYSKNFEKKWEEFINSDSANNDIFIRDNHIARYYSHSIYPRKNPAKENLLLIFGNPAPHSVKAGSPFYSEQDGKTHRIWNVLKKSEILSFYNNLEHKGTLLKKGDYESNFNIGFFQYFTMPSTTSDPKWSGISGLKKLFGIKSFKEIEKFEINRLQNQISQSAPEGGIILIFQQDAHLGINNHTDAKFKNKYKIIKMPPTRLIYSKQAQEILSSLKQS